MLYINSASASTASWRDFAIGTDADQATIDVNNRVQSAAWRKLPERGAARVTVQKQSANFLRWLRWIRRTNVMTRCTSATALVNVLDEIKASFRAWARR